MGQKIHPLGFRVGVTIDWQAHWFPKSMRTYATYAVQDQKIRELIRKTCGQEGGVSKISIERNINDIAGGKTGTLSVTIHTARPGVIIGRGGKRVDDIKEELQNLTGLKVKLTIQEINQPELDAVIVGRNIAEQLERRVAVRRAMLSAVQRTMQSGALGIKVVVSGRLGGADIARVEKHLEGQVPLHTLRADIDFAVSEAMTTYGVIGVKVWINRGRAELVPDNAFLSQASSRPVFDSGTNS